MVIEHVPSKTGYWAGRKILRSVPYVIPGEAYGFEDEVKIQFRPPPSDAAPRMVQSTQNAYVLSEDLVFMAYDMLLDTVSGHEVTDINTIADPSLAQLLYSDQQNVLDGCFQIQELKDGGRGENFIRTYYRGLIAFNPETGAWQFGVPYAMPPGKGIVIKVAMQSCTWSENQTEFDAMRVAIALRGELLYLGAYEEQHDLIIEKSDDGKPGLDPLPTSWKDYPILVRYPWAAAGEVVGAENDANLPLLAPPLAAGPTPNEVLLSAYAHDEERPFEVHDLVLDVTAMLIDQGETLAAPPDVSQSLYLDGVNMLDLAIVLNTVEDQDAAQKWIRQPTRCSLVFNPETGTWQLEHPVVLEQGQGLLLIATNTGATWTSSVDSAQYTHNRIAITLRGELLELGPR